MYNKLFTKILDSSIWLEPTPTRIVWLTFLASMDESGFVQLTSPANVAHRARVTLDEACNAIACLEGPDSESGDPDHDGRRVERVPGGWMVLNADKYRLMVTKVVIQAQTRERVRKHRARKRDAGNADVTQPNETVTPSEAVAEAVAEARSDGSIQELGNQQHTDTTQSVNAQEPAPPTPTEPEIKHKKEKPLIAGQAITIHRWMFNECVQTLGSFADDFDVLDWLWKLDDRAWRDGLVMPKRDGGAWLQSELVAEAQRRGLPLKFATPIKEPQWVIETRERRRAGL